MDHSYWDRSRRVPNSKARVSCDLTYSGESRDRKRRDGLVTFELWFFQLPNLITHFFSLSPWKESRERYLFSLLSWKVETERGIQHYWHDWRVFITASYCSATLSAYTVDLQPSLAFARLMNIFKKGQRSTKLTGGVLDDLNLIPTFTYMRFASFDCSWYISRR